MPPRVATPETLSPPLSTRRRSSSFERLIRKLSSKKRDESVLHHLREAGDVFGGIGGAPALHSALDVRRQVLQQLASYIGPTSPSSPTRPSIRPCDSLAIKIEPTGLAGESSDTAELTDGEAESFDWDSEGSTYYDSSATETSTSVPARRPFTETITVFSATKEELNMRCLLDTGMRPNVINVEKAERTGLHIRKYSGRRLIAANGAKFEPVGWIKTDFYFLRRQTAKTYPVKFLVVPKEAPFDVAFGWPFISKAGLLNHNPEAFPLDWEKMDKKSTHNKKRKGEEVKEMNRRIKEEERRAEKEKRNPGGGGQSSGGGSSGGGSSGGSQSST
ncbi:hypothetical protein LPUS_08828 [Lasallia pustulata]|uniref:Uncharacterized protein n=1 Tax=Lasallia pustulata TaxID=136370 RepID=A0A1W5D6N6_9LECA|nr:hypothetical protein LPUS_08828 [Lasallia pustulata]